MGESTPSVQDAHLPVGAPDYSFITDRLAVGDVNSHTVPGFAAVVSLLATAPWDEVAGAPPLPHRDGYPPRLFRVDINDGEGIGQAVGDGRDLARDLSEVTGFIADGLARGCVLVHCGAGKSRSVAVVCAYLCRYAGMSWSEALALVKQRRPGACPADVFHDAVERWMGLSALTTAGPRR